MRDGRFLSPSPRPCPRPFSCGRQENGQPSTFLSAAIPPPLLFLAALHLCPQIMELDQIFLWEMTGRQDRGNVHGNKRERNEASQRNEDEEIEREYFFSRYFVSLKVYLQLVSK